MWLNYIQQKHFSDVIKSLSEKKPHNLENQLGLFIDATGLLRCRGRLVNADFCESARLPILLPSKDKSTQLVIERVHGQLLHSGVSHTLSKLIFKFWIPHDRATVRKVLKQCVIYRRLENGPYKMPPMAPLPHTRV